MHHATLSRLSNVAALLPCRASLVPLSRPTIIDRHNYYYFYYDHYLYFEGAGRVEFAKSP